MRSFLLCSRLALLAGLFSTAGVYAQDNIVLKNGSEIQAKVLEVSPSQIKYRRQDNPDGPIYTTGTTDVLLIKYANGTKDVLSQSASSPASLSPAPMNPGPPATGNVGPGRLGYHHGLFSRYFTDGDGERLARSEARSLIATQPDALRAYRRGQSMHRWTYLTGGSAIALIGAGATVALLGDGGFRQHEGSRRDRGNNGATSENDGRGDHGLREVGAALAGGGVLVGVVALILDHRSTVWFRRAADRYNMHQQPATSLRFGSSQRGLGVGMVYTF